MSDMNKASVKLSSISHACIVVKDNVEKIAGDYWKMLGIGPWDIFTIEPPVIYDETYKGKPANYGFRAALCQCGSFQLEIIQPLEGDSWYKDFRCSY